MIAYDFDVDLKIDNKLIVFNVLKWIKINRLINEPYCYRDNYFYIILVRCAHVQPLMRSSIPIIKLYKNLNGRKVLCNHALHLSNFSKLIIKGFIFICIFTIVYRNIQVIKK